MERKIKKILKSKAFKYVGMPLLLFLLWAGLTLQYIIAFDSSLLILPSNYSASNFTKITFSPLTKGMKIAGEFVAQENNLGILQLRFNYHKRVAYTDEDNLRFRIKEKDSKVWYYQSVFKSGLVSDVPFLPLGFPQIVNSKGKIYDFELQSLNGNNKNAISLKNRFPIFSSKYKVVKSDLFKNKTNLISFIVKKYLRGLENIDIFFSSIVYFLPFFFYTLHLTPLGPHIMKSLKLTGITLLNILENIDFFGYKLRLVTLVKDIFLSYFDIILLFFILVDILIMQVSNDLMYIVILALWMYMNHVQNKDQNRMFIVGMGFLIMAPFLLAVNLYEAGEKSTIWAYMFLVFWFGSVLLNSEKAKRKRYRS